ncbi:MAG: nucleotide pyrophosphohydrolase [Thermoanaerobaculia bacterium]
MSEGSARSDTLAALAKEVQAFCEAREWDPFHSPKDLAIGLATEAAELLAQFRFLSDEEVEERLADANDRLAIEHEIGDTLFFLLRFCERNGIDPANALRAKLVVNESKYPVERSRGSNRKYDRL